jgi:phage tail-like protein
MPLMTPFGLNAMAALAQRRLGRRLDPYPGFNFLVEIDGLLTGGFTSVSGLDAEINYEEKYQEGGDTGVHKLPSGVTYSPLVLSHGLTDIDTLWNWFDEARRGLARRRTVSVMMLDAQQLPITWWYCVDALPKKWVGPALDASSDAVAIEQIELVYRSLKKGTLTPLLSLARAGMQLSSRR